MTIAIIKYNAGNTASVINALKRLGVEPILTDEPNLILSADKVIFPGVGEASTAMNYLKTKGLDKVIRAIRQPFLGICLGMQLLCDFSEEGNTSCLGILPYKVYKFPTGKLKVPHVGWNSIFDPKGDLFRGIHENDFFYFVHSFYVEIGEKTTSYCDYGSCFSASIEHENFYAVQFHPEKSGDVGEKLLKNFIEL